MVTLDGQVIDASGAMSGGGKTAQKGGMKGHIAAAGDVDTATIRAWEKEAAGIKQKLVSVRRGAEDAEHRAVQAEKAGEDAAGGLMGAPFYFVMSLTGFCLLRLGYRFHSRTQT